MSLCFGLKRTPKNNPLPSSVGLWPDIFEVIQSNILKRFQEMLNSIGIMTDVQHFSNKLLCCEDISIFVRQA